MADKKPPGDEEETWLDKMTKFVRAPGKALGAAANADKPAAKPAYVPYSGPDRQSMTAEEYQGIGRPTTPPGEEKKKKPASKYAGVGKS